MTERHIVAIGEDGLLDDDGTFERCWFDCSATDSFGAALHFVGTELAECVASRAGSSVYWVGPDGEVPLPTRVL